MTRQSFVVPLRQNSSIPLLHSFSPNRVVMFIICLSALCFAFRDFLIPVVDALLEDLASNKPIYQDIDISFLNRKLKIDPNDQKPGKWWI